MLLQHSGEPVSGRRLVVVQKCHELPSGCIDGGIPRVGYTRIWLMNIPDRHRDIVEAADRWQGRARRVIVDDKNFNRIEVDVCLIENTLNGQR